LLTTQPVVSIRDQQGQILTSSRADVTVSVASGTATLEGTYNTLIGEVGTRTRQAEIASQSQARLLDEARNMRDSISGVNLDEEAANLLRYQQAYQAAAQVIAVSSTLFDTLLMAVRR
jgi:flagellar hook-associated protein 1 FlgK